MRNLLQFLARYSNFLIFLILEVVAFILITTTHEYQKSAMWSSANRLVAGIEAIQTNIVEYFRLRKDNQVLAEENAYLKTQLMLLANQEEVTLERDSQYIYSHLDWEYIPAKVIDISTHKQHNYLTINKGARDSIQLDMGVVCQNGVIGIVSAVGEKYALVVPMIHTNMNLSCRLKKNDYIGRTQWMGRNHREVKLEDISRHISVELGDTIITSGLTPVFPQGLMVGTVISSDLNEGDNYHNIQVELSTDYQAIKYVQVIYNRAAELIEDPTSATEWSGLEK